MAQPAKMPTSLDRSLRIKNYSDADLKNIELEIEDPLSVGPISESRPKSGEVLTFVAQYTSPNELICAFGHRHKNGFVLSSESGENYLIGRHCARSHYGLEWDVLANKIESEIKRKRNLVWQHRVSSEILSSESELWDITAHTSVVAFDMLRIELAKLPRSVYNACQTNGWLCGYFAERDHQAEKNIKEKARQEYRHLMSRSSSRIEKKWAEEDLLASEQPVVRYQGRNILKPPHSIFKRGNKMQPRLETLVKTLLSQARILDGPTSFGHPDLIAKSLIEGATQLEKILDEIGDAINFFSSGQLSLFREWLSSRDYEHLIYRQMAQGFTIKEEGSQPVRIVLPDELKPLKMDLLNRIKFNLRPPKVGPRKSFAPS